jgi:hypothetical protein
VKITEICSGYRNMMSGGICNSRVHRVLTLSRVTDERHEDIPDSYKSRRHEESITGETAENPRSSSREIRSHYSFHTISVSTVNLGRLIADKRK